MKPINILYLIDSMAHGGAERQLADLIRNLDRQRFRPHLCTLKPSTGLFAELDVTKECLNFSSFAKPSLMPVLFRLSSFIRRNRISIVQTFFQDPCLLGALVKPFTGVKLVGTFLDLGFWRTEAESFKMKMSYPFFNGFIANSIAVKHHFCLTDGINPHRVEVIYNGFDLSAIPEAAFSPRVPAISPIVGIVANLNRPVKRVQDFIAAAALVHQSRPDTTFLVVGGGHLQADLELQANELGLAGSATFTGMVPNPLDYTARMSVGVITSETEGFSNSIIEYMACGIPVVVTDVGGNPELVEDGVNGYLYELGDIAELAEKILYLLESSDKRKQIGEANRAKIADHFSMGKMIENTESYYRTLGLSL